MIDLLKLFLPDSVLEVCIFLRICPFLLGCSTCWHITVVIFSYNFYFCHIGCYFSFISYFYWLEIFFLFLDDTGLKFFYYAYIFFNYLYFTDLFFCFVLFCFVCLFVLFFHWPVFIGFFPSILFFSSMIIVVSFVLMHLDFVFLLFHFLCMVA